MLTTTISTIGYFTLIYLLQVTHISQSPVLNDYEIKQTQWMDNLDASQNGDNNMAIVSY